MMGLMYRTVFGHLQKVCFKANNVLAVLQTWSDGLAKRLMVSEIVLQDSLKKLQCCANCVQSFDNLTTIKLH